MAHKPSLTTILTFLLLALALNAAAGQKQRLLWKERNNQIIHKSVCFNHAFGTIDYRQCRSYAKKHFKIRCRYYQDKYRKVGHDPSSEIKEQEEKFCLSARIFSPM